MSGSINLTFKTTLFHKPSSLVIEKNSIILSSGSKKTEFFKEDIESFRYGVTGISGYSFYIGRIYKIEVKSKSNEELSIILKTLYRIRKKSLEQKYLDALNAICENFFYEKVYEYANEFENGKELEIEGVKFFKVGIALEGNKNLLLWKDIGVRKYSYYYTIFSKTNQNNYKILEFKTFWNSYLVFNTIKLILKKKNLLD